MGIFDTFKTEEEPELVQEIQPESSTPQSSKPETYLTMREACDFLRISDETLRSWEKKGKIIAYQLPSMNESNKQAGTPAVRSKRYKQSDLQALLTPIQRREQ